MSVAKMETERERGSSRKLTVSHGVRVSAGEVLHI